MSIGVGSSTSATIGANDVMRREIQLAIPIEVTENKVGNIFGCATYTIVNAPEIPNLAIKTKKTKNPPALLLSQKMIMRPATIEMQKKGISRFLALNLVNRYPDKAVAIASAMSDAN